MRLPILIYSLAIFLTPLAALAGTDHTVTQKGKKFSPSEININVDDSIIFVNDDKTRHNVYSKSAGLEFNVKKQKPGDRDTISFDRAGIAEVRCAIHPKMKLVITVGE